MGGAEWIVFATRDNADEDADIYAIRADGSQLRRLTSDPSDDWSPDLSPDGQRVVFVSDRDGNRNLYMVNIDGTGLTQLTFGKGEDYYDPDWSPGGEYIAFVSSYGSGKSEIWVARVSDAGLDDATLTRVTRDDFNDYDPVWSPDGEMIAYSSFRVPGKGYSIFVINADGSQTRQITTEETAREGWDRSPQWSPDGQSLIFTRWSSGDIKENRNFWTLETWDEQLGVLYTDNFEAQLLRGAIYTVNADGTGLRPLMEDENNNWAPCWSPDGQWIAFVSDRDGDSDIYIVRADGSHVTSVTSNDIVDSMPSWAAPNLATGAPPGPVREATPTPVTVTPAQRTATPSQGTTREATPTLAAATPSGQGSYTPVRCGQLFDVSVSGPIRFSETIYDEKAQGVFLIVELEIVNLTNSTYDTLWEEDYEILALIDGQETRFPASFDASFGLYWDNRDKENFIHFTDDIPAGGPFKTAIAFDVNPRGTGWTLLFHPNTWDGSADCSIAIPLQ